MNTHALWAVLLLASSGCLDPAGDASRPDVTFDAIRFDTEAGAITIVLYPEAAPQTVALMLAYVEEGYYVGREFNRVVPGHVIQLVDKVGGATDDARRVPLETDIRFHFSAGAAGIARGEDPNSGGPEIFIMDFATSHLDANYTVWGQVVDGLDAVHKAARVEAVDFRQVPNAPLLLTDRMAIDGVAITGAERATWVLPAADAAALPLVVAKNRREGDFRHSLEWPRNLEPGASADVTWYIRSYNGTVAPDAAALTLEVGGEVVPVEDEPETPGVLHARWTPPAPGRWNATLAEDGEALAMLVICVPGHVRCPGLGWKGT